MKKKYEFSKKEFGLRLAKLREQKDISARKMSLDIAQNKNYINSIESGKNYPTMQVFFTICEYLKVTPQCFFDAKCDNPLMREDTWRLLDGLSPDQIHHIFLLVNDLRDSNDTNL